MTWRWCSDVSIRSLSAPPSGWFGAFNHSFEMFVFTRVEWLYRNTNFLKIVLSLQSTQSEEHTPLTFGSTSLSKLQPDPMLWMFDHSSWQKRIDASAMLRSGLCGGWSTVCFYSGCFHCTGSVFEDLHHLWLTCIWNHDGDSAMFHTRLQTLTVAPLLTSSYMLTMTWTVPLIFSPLPVWFLYPSFQQ